MTTDGWPETFLEVHGRGMKAWAAGRRRPDTMFSPEDRTFLESAGCSAQELFDFVDDAQRYGEPDAATALAVQAVRRDHFLSVLQGRRTGKVASMADLPAKADAVDGIPWLPRIIAKARLKLRGEMPDDLMYGCGGDRDFLRRIRMTASQFLELVRDSGDDDRRIVEAVKRSARGG